MTFGLGFFYFYAIGVLATAMWLVHHYRTSPDRHTRKDWKDLEDSDFSAGAILIAMFWLPIAVTLLLFALIAVCYDTLSSLWT